MLYAQFARRRLALALSMVIGVGGIAGCGSQQPVASEPAGGTDAITKQVEQSPEEAFVGTWKLHSMLDDDGETIKVDDLAGVVSIRMYVVLDKDHTGVLDLGSTVYDITWKATDDGARIEDETGAGYDVALLGSMDGISLKNDQDYYELVRSTEEERMEGASQDAASGATGTGEVDPSKLPKTATEECLDKYGMVTAYAVSELSGEDLVRTLYAQGFIEVAGNFSGGEDGSFHFSAFDNSKVYALDELKALPKGGGTVPVAFMLRTNKYETSLDMVKGLSKCVVADVKVVSDSVAVAVVYGPSMKEYFMFVSQDTLALFSNEALEAGLFDSFGRMAGKLKDDESYGSTVAEVWDSYVGGAVGDYVRDHPVS